MKRSLIPLSLLLVSLTGCQAVGEKSASLTAVYFTMFTLSLVLLILYRFTVRQKTPWTTMLFSLVPIVNIGYGWLSSCTTLDMALWANRLSYFGSVFLPMSMLMIIFDATKTPYKPRLAWTLIGVALGIFVIASSPGFSDLYYREVSLEIVNGAASLNKVYGVLHPLYLVYLLGYFAAMIAVVVHAAVRKTVPSTAHALMVTFAVLVNIGVWMLGQLTHIDFEFLSVSYIISELFLLGLHYLIQDTPAQFKPPVDTLQDVPSPPAQPGDDQIARFLQGVEELTRTERLVYDLYLEGKTTKEVLAALSITENTLKYHNKNIYGKLGVSSRKQLKELAKTLATAESSV